MQIVFFSIFSFCQILDILVPHNSAKKCVVLYARNAQSSRAIRAACSNPC